MGVVNTKSTQVTNADAAVQALNTTASSNSRTYSAIATVATAAADDDGSVYRFVRVHSSWHVVSIRILADAITAGTSYDVGLYQTATNGAAELDKDCYASAVNISAGTALWLEMAYEARDINLIGQTVWADGGLTADPGRWYDLVLTANTVGSSASDIALWVEWTV